IAPRLGKAGVAAGTGSDAVDASAGGPAAVAGASEDVDPLAEAEVYIAYGRDGQAEEILKEALARNPGREDVQLKLLEVYAARKDKASFSTLAAGLHKQTGGAGDTWIKAAAMGYTLDPGNPMYEAGKDAVAAVSRTGAATDVDLDLGLGEAGTSTDITLDAGAADAAAGADTGILDLGAGEKTEEPAARQPDFDLEVPAAGGGGTDSTPAPVPAPAQDTNMLDFQIDLPKASEEPPTKATPPAAAAAAQTGDGGLDFKLDDLNLNLDSQPKAEAAPGGEKDGHWYDVQTKFDLAKAYQEMGDKDGAKEILQEVIKEGDAEQKAQAKTLMDSLG
ncbi:MAG TPA: FimV/HubP family polar landmark protein, partial [Burkholderiales bacterium]|nr:FimV/HubP family polar landmark protein [Burkholderiales bacterium]